MPPLLGNLKKKKAATAGSHNRKSKWRAKDLRRVQLQQLKLLQPKLPTWSSDKAFSSAFLTALGVLQCVLPDLGVHVVSLRVIYLARQ